MVTKFHELNGAVINKPDSGPEVAVLRIRLIIEEYAETIAALHGNDVVETADGLADLLYVIYGAAVSYGVRCQDVFERPITAPAESFDREDVLRFCRRITPRVQRACVAIDCSHADRAEALATLAEELCAIGARVWGLPMRELFEEVHRSNMTKTFAGAKAATGGKYPAGVKAKGPGYEPPDIAGVLVRAKEAWI
jgi:predicted HAD superfamily Cof-like phosphohydrolase